MKGKSLAWILETPLTERDVQRFGIKELAELGWKVTIFDNSQLFNARASAKYHLHEGEDSSYIVIRPHSLKSFFKSIREVRPEFVIDNCALDFSGTRAYLEKVIIRTFIRLTERYVYISLTSGHNVSISEGPAVLLYMKRIIRRPWMIPWFFVRPKIFFLAGEAKKKSEMIKARCCFLVHGYDYDQFLSVKNAQKDMNKVSRDHKRILFLDQKGTFGVDSVLEGKKDSKHGNRNYYEHINSFLTTMKGSLGADSRIQLHPKSTCHFYTHPISDLPLAEAVSNSDVIVGHNSTSIQVAVLFKKPIILVTTPFMTFEEENNVQIRQLASLLNLEVMQWDQTNITKIPDVDEVSYESFVHKYIKSNESPKGFSWNIIDSYLCDILQDEQ